MAASLRQWAEQKGDHPFIICDNREWTYSESLNLLSSLLPPLTLPSSRPCQRIAIICPDPVTQVFLILSIHALNGVVVPLNPKFPEATLTHHIKTLSCSAYISSHPIKQLKTPHLPIPELKTKIGALVRVPDSTHAQHPASIILSSGTSSQPKGILHTHDQHQANARACTKALHFQGNHRWLLSLPLHHVSGMAILYRVLEKGASLVIKNPKSPISRTCLKHQVSHVSLVSTQLRQWLEDPAPYPNLQAVMLGGSEIPNALIQKALQNKLPIHLSYGLTETASQVCISKKITQKSPIQSAGKPGPHAQIKVLKSGQIAIKSQSLCSGYIDQDLIKLPLSKDGWFITQDIGQLNHKGELSIKGRMDRAFLSGGEVIQPEKIEARLCAHPAISHAKVHPQKDPEFGNRPVAYIQTKADIDPNTIKRYLKQYLAKFECPELIFEKSA